MPPAARPVCAPGVRAHETRSVRKIQNRNIRTTCAAPSRVLPGPGAWVELATAAIASPMNVTRLPDTRPPFWGRPGTEDLVRAPRPEPGPARRRQDGRAASRTGWSPRQLGDCVNMNCTQEPSRPSAADVPRAVVTSPPAGGSGSALDACRGPMRRSLEIRKSARRSKHEALCSGCSSPRPGDYAACCRGHRAPAFQRRSLWLDQASARRALAVPPRGSSDASATAATSSRCSPGPSVRSRRLPGAAA